MSHKPRPLSCWAPPGCFQHDGAVAVLADHEGGELDTDVESIHQLQRPGPDLLVKTLPFEEGHGNESCLLQVLRNAD